MIYGIGTDIVAVARIALLHQKYSNALARRVLSRLELEQCAGCFSECRRQNKTALPFIEKCGSFY